MMRFIFQHGWGFSGSCWHRWLPLLDAPPTLGNRGYWGTPAPIGQGLPQPGCILVCHSLGIHFIPQDFIPLAKIVVIIGGFAHFHGTTATDGRFTRRHLQRMLSRVATEPEGLIHDFHRDCEYLEPPDDCGPMDTPLLAADLRILNESRLDKSRCLAWPPTLLLHGQNDRIVPPQRAAELAALPPTGRLTIINEAGHGLPFTHPQLCLNLIVDFYHHIVHSGE